MNTLWTGSSSSPLPRHEPGDNEEVAAHLPAPYHDEYNHDIESSLSLSPVSTMNNGIIRKFIDNLTLLLH